MANYPTLEDRITQKLNDRQETGSLRSLSINKNSIDFCSNDYLGFSKCLKVNPAKSHGSTGSRLLSGNSMQFQKLENKLAQIHNAQAALIFNSGYDANIGLFSCIADKADTVIYDQYIHASIRDGLRLSSCRSFSFKHNDIISLEQKLKQASGHIIVAIESIYSMDGDEAPLNEILKLCEKYNANIILDEAHATGVIGKKALGLASKLGIEKNIFARVHTFGKALGCHGAIVLGSKNLKEYLINFSRSLIYTTALSEHSLNAIEAAYDQLLEDSEDERKKLKENISLFQSLLSEKLKSKLIKSNSPIQCIIVPGNDAVKIVEKKIQEKGFHMKAIIHPTVEKGKERIRICIHSYNSEQEIRDCVKNLEELIQ